MRLYFIIPKLQIHRRHKIENIPSSSTIFVVTKQTPKNKKKKKKSDTQHIQQNRVKTKKVTTHENDAHNKQSIFLFLHFQKRMRATLFIAGGEDDGSSLISDDAFRDSSVTEMLRNRAALSQYSVGANDLDDECVTSRPGLQLVHLLEFRLPQCRLRFTLLRRWCR